MGSTWNSAFGVRAQGTADPQSLGWAPRAGSLSASALFHLGCALAAAARQAEGKPRPALVRDLNELRSSIVWPGTQPRRHLNESILTRTFV